MGGFGRPPLLICQKNQRYCFVLLRVRVQLKFRWQSGIKVEKAKEEHIFIINASNSVEEIFNL